MVRIVGVNIPDKKKVPIALSYIYGIGRPLAQKILDEAAISKDKKAQDLTPPEVSRLRDIIEKSFKIENDLRREIMMNVKRLIDVNTYRGSRHQRKLPVHGQRTKTNSRTRRGNVRRTMGSGKRRLEKT